MNGDPAQPADRTITADTACIECSYNLRGLTWAHRCPECGTAAMLSLPGSGSRCRFDPAFERAEAGLVSAGVSRLVCCLVPMATPIALAFAAGAIHSLATSPFAGPEAEARRRLRSVLVFLVLATTALWVAGFAWSMDKRSTSAESFQGTVVFGFAAEALAAIAWLVFLRHWGTFAKATGRPRLARRFRRGAVGTCSLSLLWATAAAGAPFHGVPMMAWVVLMASAPLPFIDAAQAVRRLRESINAQERFDALHAGCAQTFGAVRGVAGGRWPVAREER